MGLIKITEPGHIDKLASTNKRVVGIDLGTTNSLVASVYDKRAKTLPDERGQSILPSAVYYGDKTPIVGCEAMPYKITDPKNLVVSVKRLMGRDLGEIANIRKSLPLNLIKDNGSKIPLIETAQGDLSAVEVSADILYRLKLRAEEVLGGSLYGAVITVPAYFDDTQRQATRDAAKLADITVLRLINEPTAAALAYGLDEHKEGNIVVFDLGGGTFDVSVLRLCDGVFEVLSTIGDMALGGDDIDQILLQWVLQESGIAMDDLSDSDTYILNDIIVESKIKLSQHTSVELCYKNWTGFLTRDTFNRLIQPLVNKCLGILKLTLKDALLKQNDIDNIVLVGGSTRIPFIREEVKKFLGEEPLVSLNPDNIVALGAAQHADMLAGNSIDSVLLLDLIPLSLGIETMGGLMERLINRNTTIPTAKTCEFTTAIDGQTAMSIDVYQGDRELVADNRRLSKLELRGIPPMSAGLARICVTFQVDADGVLNVKAMEKTSGVSADVRITPSCGLTDDDIREMIQTSFEKAGKDKNDRKLIEAGIEAKQLLGSVDKCLSEYSDMLSEKEFISIRDCNNALQEKLLGHDVDAIKLCIDELTNATDEFAMRCMNATVKSALTGRLVDDVNKERR